MIKKEEFLKRRNVIKKEEFLKRSRGSKRRVSFEKKCDLQKNPMAGKFVNLLRQEFT